MAFSRPFAQLEARYASILSKVAKRPQATEEKAIKLHRGLALTTALAQQGVSPWRYRELLDKNHLGSPFDIPNGTVAIIDVPLDDDFAVNPYA